MDVLTRPIINETKRAFDGRLVEERELKEKSWQEKLTRRDAVASTERKSGTGLRGDADILSRRSVNSKLTAKATIVKARDNINAPIFIPEYKPSSTMDGIARPAAVDISQHPSKQHVYARAVGGGIMVPSMRQGSLPAEVSDGDDDYDDDDDEAGVDAMMMMMMMLMMMKLVLMLLMMMMMVMMIVVVMMMLMLTTLLPCIERIATFTHPILTVTHPSLTVTHPFIYTVCRSRTSTPLL